jgi:hypothetical protein
VGDPVNYQSYAGCTIAQVHSATGRVDVKIPGRITAAGIAVSEVRPRVERSRAAAAGAGSSSGRTWWYAPAALRHSGPWGDLEAVASALHVAEAQKLVKPEAMERAQAARLNLAEALFAAALAQAALPENDEDDGKAETVRALISKATTTTKTSAASGGEEGATAAPPICAVSEKTLATASQVLEEFLVARRMSDVKLGMQEFMQLVGGTLPVSEAAAVEPCAASESEAPESPPAASPEPAEAASPKSAAAEPVEAAEKPAAAPAATLAATPAATATAAEEVISTTPQTTAEPVPEAEPAASAVEAEAKVEEEASRFWETEPESLVGKRVEVLWSQGQRYGGDVTEYRGVDGKHHVRYDDGDDRWYRMALKTFWLVNADGTQGEKFLPEGTTEGSNEASASSTRVSPPLSASTTQASVAPSPLSTFEALSIRYPNKSLAVLTSLINSFPLFFLDS